MKNFLMILILTVTFAGQVFAEEIKDEMYYKRQIQNQRYLYGVSGAFRVMKDGRTDVLENFVDAKFDMNSTSLGMTLPMGAINYNQPEMLDTVLKNGANPDTESLGFTPLVYSIEKKNSECIDVLVKNKADVNKDCHYGTPLNYAIKKKQTKIVEILLKNGAVPDEKTYKLVDKSKDEYLKDLFSTYGK